MVRSLLMIAGMLLGIYGSFSQAAPPPQIDLDPVLNLQSSEPVSYSKLVALLAPLMEDRHISENLDPRMGHSQSISWNLQGKRLRPALFGGTFEPQYMRLQLKASKVVECSFHLRAKGNLVPLFEAISGKLEQAFGEAPQKSDGSGDNCLSWKRDTFYARLYFYPSTPRTRDDVVEFAITVLDNNFLRMVGVKPKESITIAPQTVVENDLDFLLQFSELWRCTPDEFEKRYRPKTDAQQAGPPQFEWMNVERSRAKFSRQVSPNVEAVLTLFGKSVPVEEAVVEFMDGRAARATVSFYNGNGPKKVSLTDFTNTFRNVGANLGKILNVSPSNQSASGSQPVKTVSWGWKTTEGLAMLEHNDYSAEGPAGKPEFLRLKLAAHAQQDWITGRLAGGMQPAGVAKNITATSDGDVYVSAVPMVNQGINGDSAFACCQRLFEFMRIPFDKGQLAQMSVAASVGSNAMSMHYFLTKVDDKFKVSLKSHVNPLQLKSNSGSGKRRVSPRQFSLLIKEYVDKGIPLLWAMELGRFPEEPPLPAEGQTNGVQMRLIIGYNTATNQILFSDSRGAGHELKRMGETEGYEATLGLYSLASSGL